MEQKIGLLVGQEWSFPPAFIDEVNRREAGVTAEYVSLDITRMGVSDEYAVIIDRISHEVGFYRAYLKHASLLGTKVVNNPFMWPADDKFLDATSPDCSEWQARKPSSFPTSSTSQASRTRKVFAASNPRWIGKARSTTWDFLE